MKFAFKNRFFKSFEPVNLGKEISFNLNGAFSQINSSVAGKLFLNRFSVSDLFEIFEEVGILPHLEALGFHDFSLTTDVDESRVQYLKLYTGEKLPNNILFDLRLSESKFIPDKKFFNDNTTIIPYDMVVIEWLSAQNPMNEKFTGGKPQLPGQKKPGLGILKFCFEMMKIVGHEVTRDGFLDIPDHMHGAVMYSKNFQFFDPVHEAIFRAILRDLRDYSLSDVSWGMITGTIIEKYKNAPQVYDPSEQIFPVSSRMNDYFESRNYKSVFNKYYRLKKYRFEFNEMLKIREDILKKKSMVDV
jgi:hypothetical protein